ncbi:hypothetical protein ACP4OV_030802 [Aristida adscensionis]
MSPVGILSTSLPLAILIASHLTLSASSLDPTNLHHESNADLHALLCLKLHLSNSPGLVAAWNDSNQICSWSGVSCSKRHSSRVVALDLESLNLRGQIPHCISNITYLTRIHLPNNQLSGYIPTELGQLSKLRYLNLSFNNLSGMIPDTLSSCFHLRIIDLASNSLSGNIPEGLGTLRSLAVLRLTGNSLIGNIPLSLGSSSSLVSVILTNNSLTGPIPLLLANSSSLQVLALTKNHLSGEIPPALFNSTSLQKLALGVNHFVGSIPSFTHTGSPLQYLILQSNDLAGVIPSTFGNFSSLIWLLLGDNNFCGSIPSSIGEIPNLQELDLSYNILSGTVPTSLYNMSALTYLGMGKNSLIGEIPHSIGFTLPSICILIMQGNQFQGQIPASLSNSTNLHVIDLRDNAFHGIIPPFGTLPNLVELNLGLNQLEAGDWSFLFSLTNCTKLLRLYLDSNILQGILPGSIYGLSNSLEELSLAANKISGTIPQEIEHLTNLTILSLEHNLLTGYLPSSLGNLRNLFLLSLSQNKLSGQIPLSISNLSHLNELYLQENNLSGPIPRALGFCKSLVTLNLSYNIFSGTIPIDLFTLSSLSKSLDLSHNQLSGKIPLEISGLINLGTLSISNNQLSGQIPSTLGACVHLESIHMEANLLDGTIPESLTNLRGIMVMDLSQNNLSGEIPAFIETLSDIKLLNLSLNNLEGPVPVGGIFQNASEVFVQGNKKLCTETPLLQLPLCSVEISKRSRESKIVKIVGSISLSVVLLLCLVVVLLKKRKKAIKSAHPSCKELKRFSYGDLVKATNGFSLANLVGSGKYGSVYKGRFEFDEHTVAVKVFKLDQLGAPRSFLAECDALRNTRHRNLIRVITACSTFDPAGYEFKALILEYMPNGSLEDWLYPKLNERGLKRPLSLGSRIIIAMDIASALDYLHNQCMPPMVHCDLKPGNVLLDDVMGTRLADFGLAKFLHSFTYSCHHSSTSLLGPRGSIGYIAPEYGFGGKLSTEGDVYSYGIIILEMLTGRRPTDEMFVNGMNLHKYVEERYPEKIGKVLDPCILPSFEDGDADNNIDHENHATAGPKNCIMHLVKLGLACSMETPKDRPTMQDVYTEVTTIEDAFAALRG